MGVNSLWQLLSPAGQVTKIESLRGKRLAIDASIWMVQFLSIASKYRGGDNGKISGNPTSNYHIFGFFRRIVKLQSLGIKPVFVFDGQYPEIKKATLLKRYKLRQEKQVNLKKIAQRHIMDIIEGKIDLEKLKEQNKAFTQSDFKSLDYKLSNSEEREIELLFEEYMRNEEEDGDYSKLEQNLFFEKHKTLLIEHKKDLQAFQNLPREDQEKIVKDQAQQKRNSHVQKLQNIDDREEIAKVQLENTFKNIENTAKFRDTKEELFKQDRVKRLKNLIEKNGLDAKYIEMIDDGQIEKRIYQADGNRNKMMVVLKEVEEKYSGVQEFMKRIQPVKDKPKTKKMRLNDIDDKVKEMYKYHNGNKVETFDQKDLEFDVRDIDIVDYCKYRGSFYGNNVTDDEFEKVKNILGNFKSEQEQIIDLKNSRLGVTDNDILKEVYGLDCKDEYDLCDFEEIIAIGFSGHENPFNPFEESIASTDINIVEKPKQQTYYQQHQYSKFSETPENSEKKQPYPFLDPPKKPENPNPINPTKNKNQKQYERMFHEQQDDYHYESIDKYILLKNPEQHQQHSQEPQDQEEQTLLEQNFDHLNSHSNFFQTAFEKLTTLLQYFGIPYIQSPSEAEAQCAYQEYNGLVDGVITEDSDTFLFGGLTVYRNFFKNNGNICESYQVSHIQKILGLNREKLILLALTLGCDYCIGIKGVGIVNSAEIVAAFETFEAMERFKDWAENPDYWLSNKVLDQTNQNTKEVEYRMKHKNYKKQWEISENFPDRRVLEAFVDPLVDKSTEQLKWGKPVFESLENFCKEVFGIDEIDIQTFLEPLKEEIEKPSEPVKITEFFQKDVSVGVIQSKRLQQSVEFMARKDNKTRINDKPAENGNQFATIIEEEVEVTNCVQNIEAPIGFESNVIEEFGYKKRRTKAQIWADNKIIGKKMIEEEIEETNSGQKIEELDYNKRRTKAQIWADNKIIGKRVKLNNNKR